MSESPPIAIEALSVPARRRSLYPEPFLSRMGGREKRQLGDAFGLKNFGVNLTRLDPGGISALMHTHSRQDELIYILEGEPVLVTDKGEFPLKPGMCAGFPANGTAHMLANRTDRDVVYLEIGDRTPGDLGSYPTADMAVGPDAAGMPRFSHRDGTAYPAPHAEPTQAIRAERRVAQPADRVWLALTQAERIGRWLMQNDFQPIPGHRFTFRAAPVPGWTGVTNCRVLEVDPGRRLVYSWGDGTESDSGLRTILDWRLEPQAGGTLVRMEQTGFRPQDEAGFRGMGAGWPRILERLEQECAV